LHTHAFAHDCFLHSVIYMISMQVRGWALNEDLEIEHVFVDGAKAAKVQLERARIVGGQVAAHAGVHAQKMAKAAVTNLFVRAAPLACHGRQRERAHICQIFSDASSRRLLLFAVDESGALVSAVNS
jgi:hypothetical protein